MKIILLFILGLTFSNSVFADDEYSNMVYTGAVFMYWCNYLDVPKSVKDLAKVTNVNDPNPKLTLPIEKWMQSVQFKVVGKELKIIQKSDTNGSVKSSEATSNCDSFKHNKPQSNNVLQPTPKLLRSFGVG
jgi:hypothetical protein